MKAKTAYGHIYNRVKQNAGLHEKKMAAGVTTPSENEAMLGIEANTNNGGALMPYQSSASNNAEFAISEIPQQPTPTINQLQLIPKKAPSIPKPKWHAPWKLYRVISGHLGWVRCVAVEPGNEWFVTGAADRVIKVWDLASGKLKLSLTGKESSG